MHASMALSRKLGRVLGLTYGVLFAVLAVAPHDRATWALEHALVFALWAAGYALRGHFIPSRRAALLLFAFMCLHEVGAHYTYSEVPYDRWFETLAGVRLNALLGFERNHYDRLLHFAFGLLLTRLLRELIQRFSCLGDLGQRVGAIGVVMSASMIYELIEWGAAVTFGEGTGTAYLGTQGDEWDAHKDMALATLGSLLALIDRGLFVRRRRTEHALSSAGGEVG